jgi:RNA polymerase sigma factor (sigma-70 family)
MSDYRVTVKVRNNRILKAMKEIGAEPGQKWCEANGLVYTQINNLINMTESPLLKTGALSTSAERLCDVLGKLAEELWTNDQIRPLEKNFTELDMTQDQVMALLPLSETSYIQDFDKKDLEQVIGAALGTLDNKHRKILNLRYKEGLSLEEIAEKYDITKERVRQIESKALRILRHPSTSSLLKPFLEGAR